MAPLKGSKRHASVPLPNTGGTVNLTLVTNGDGGPRTVMNNGEVLFQHGQANNQGTGNRNHHRQNLTYKDYPKISDFLISLDQNFDDPPRGFARYTNLLTSEAHLGFGRIHEIVDAIAGLPVFGGEWLKGRLERAATNNGESIIISEGTANLIYQEMKLAVEQLRSGNSSIF
jgi:hypothetical protein